MVCISNRICVGLICVHFYVNFSILMEKNNKNTTWSQRKKEEIIMCALNSLHGKIHWMHNFISFHSLNWTNQVMHKPKKKSEKWKEIKQKSEKEKQQLHCTGKWSSCCCATQCSFIRHRMHSKLVSVNEWSSERGSKWVKCLEVFNMRIFATKWDQSIAREKWKKACTFYLQRI